MQSTVNTAIQLSKALAETLRSSGLRVQLYCEQKKFKQKMAYADKLKVPFAVLLGEDEIAEGKCSVKNMKTGEVGVHAADGVFVYVGILPQTDAFVDLNITDEEGWILQYVL